MGTMAVSGSCLLKAGINVSSEFEEGSSLTNPDISTADEMWDILIRQAEAYVNVASGKNWTDVYTTLDADVKYLLEEAVSNIAAEYALSYAIENSTNTIGAEDTITLLHNRADKIINLLSKIGTKKFVEAPN